MRSCSSGWAAVIEAIATAALPTTACPERAGTADIADSRFESDSDPAQSVFRDLAVLDRQHIVGSPAGNAVLAHERLGRFEHRLAAKDQGLGVSSSGVPGGWCCVVRRKMKGQPGESWSLGTSLRHSEGYDEFSRLTLTSERILPTMLRLMVVGGSG